MARILSAQALIAAAARIAADAHVGQTDRAGHPLIGHPQRVAEHLDDPEAKAAALLHDVVEDSAVTLADLFAAGIPEQVVAAVDALTRRDDEDYPTAVLRAAADPLARRVKRADLMDNGDPTRLAQLDAEMAVGLRDRYAEARRLLDRAPPPSVSFGHRALVIDDLRVLPDLDAAYARTSDEGVAVLEDLERAHVALDELWLDYRLGSGRTIRPVVRWLTHRYRSERAPRIGQVIVHTSDALGAREVQQLLDGWLPVRRIEPDRLRVRVLV